MYRMVLASSPGDCELWMQLRRDLYLGSGLIGPQQLVEGAYRDKYDSYSHHVLVLTESDEAVGCGRLILRDEGRPLQVEEHFELNVATTSAEVSGFAIAEDHKAGLATLGLTRALVEVAGDLGVETLYAEVEPWFLSALQRMGFPFAPLTEAKWLYNTWNLTAAVAVAQIWDVVAKANHQAAPSAMAAYFSSPWTWTISAADLVPQQRDAVRERV